MYSDLFLRSFYQDMGCPEWVEEYKDVPWSWTYCLFGALYARWPAYCQCKSRSHNKNLWYCHYVSPSESMLLLRLHSWVFRHLVRTIHGHSDWVRCVTPSDDGRLIASCSTDQVSFKCLSCLFRNVEWMQIRQRESVTRWQERWRWSSEDMTMSLKQSYSPPLPLTQPSESWQDYQLRLS